MTGAVFEGTSKGNESFTCALTNPAGWETKKVTLAITDYEANIDTWTWDQTANENPSRDTTSNNIKVVDQSVEAGKISVSFKPPSGLTETKSYECEVNVYDPDDDSEPEATDSALVYLQKIG